LLIGIEEAGQVTMGESILKETSMIKKFLLFAKVFAVPSLSSAQTICFGHAGTFPFLFSAKPPLSPGQNF
jgi:hypothetical protein